MLARIGEEQPTQARKRTARALDLLRQALANGYADSAHVWYHDRRLAQSRRLSAPQPAALARVGAASLAALRAGRSP